MGFDRTLPSPVFGVSTVPPVARPEGFASQQTNWRNDQQDKLTRRPKFKALDVVVPDWTINPTTIETHTSFQDGVRQETLVGFNGTTMEIHQRQGYGTFTTRTKTLPAAWFARGLDIGVNTIEGEVYIWNRNMPMEIEQTASVDKDLYENVAVANVASALNYAESVTLKVEVFGSTGIPTTYEATYSVPGLTSGNQAIADEARATNTVAAELAKLLNHPYQPPTGEPVDTPCQAYAEGSNILIRARNGSSIQVDVSSGRGDGSVHVINYTASSIEGLPKYCEPGVVRTIAPDPTSKDGRYYLEAVPSHDASSNRLKEVIWTECEDPINRLQFTADSFYIVVSDVDIDLVTPNAREVGDDESNPPRNFVGKPIQQMETFQDRLVILAGSKMNISKTDDYGQFWLSSALEILVTDPTDVGTSGNSSTLKHTVFHNRDLLVFAEDAQFKVDGQTAITPQTAAMPITTANECDLSVPPVLMGAYVFYANNYGSSAGIRRFEVEADTVVDTSTSITDHVIGFMPGTITKLVSNANQTMLLCRSSKCLQNQFFVFEQQYVNEKVVYSWAEWRLREGVTINDIDLYNEVITVRYNDKYYMNCDLKEGEVYPIRDVCLDQFGMSTINANGRLVLPATYPFNLENTFKILVAGNQRDTLQELTWNYTWTGQHELWFDEAGLEGTPVFYGFTYESLYEPTRPYERDRQGNVRTTDRLRIAHYFLELSNTYRLKRRIISDWWDEPDQTFTSLDSAVNEFIDEVHPYTGQWRPQIGMNADDCTVQFIDDSPYAATIVSIAYRGQQYSTKSRR